MTSLTRRLNIVFLLAILISLPIVIITGCLDSGYKHTVYDPTTGKPTEQWQLDYNKAMATSDITDVNLIIADGSCLQFSKSSFIYDGNDWVKMGTGISIGAGAFTGTNAINTIATSIADSNSNSK